MARDEPLTLQSLSPDVVEAARAAAAASGLTLDEWLNRTILGIVGGFAAARNGGRRAEPPEGRWADPLSSISQNLKSAADAASASGVTFEQWLSQAILSNTTAVAQQGRSSEEPNLSLFRAGSPPRPPAPRVVPIRESVTVPTPAPPPPPAMARSEPSTVARSEPPVVVPIEPPVIAPSEPPAAARSEPPATPPSEPPARSLTGEVTAVPIPDLPSFPDMPAPMPEPVRAPPTPEIPDVVVAPAKVAAKPSALYEPSFLNDLAGEPRTMPADAPRREPPTFDAPRVADRPAAQRSDIPELPPDSAEPAVEDVSVPDAVLDKRLAQIIADAREEVAAMARNAAVAPPQQSPPLVVPTTIGGTRVERRRRGGPWLTVGALLVLAVVAAAVWVLPKLPQLGVQFEKKPDYVQQLPAPGAAGRRDPASVDKIETLPLNRPGESERTAGEALPEPPAQHVDAYRQAATAGNVKAQMALAQLYLRGDGVAKDLAEAARWYREAASRHNDANAQYALGVLLDRGIGVEKDPIEALLWFQRAAQQGHPAALTNTGVAYSKGEVVPRDYAKAFSYFQRAADAGVAQAQFNLGLLYENGLGVQKDPVQAYRWYSAAAAGGDPGAGQALERLTPTLSADDLARAKDLVRQATGKP